MIRAGYSFYALGMLGIGLQLLQYGEFIPVTLYYWPEGLAGLSVFAVIAGLFLVLSGILILFNIRQQKTALILALAWFASFLLNQVPFMILKNPYVAYLGAWTNPLKALALCGGALSVYSCIRKTDTPKSQTSFMSFLDKYSMVMSRIFFSIMLVCFGTSHFLYAEQVSTLVPSWIPWHMFWTYFAGTALICSGISIMIKFKIEWVALLTAIMIFVWFIILHIPRAINDPHGNKGNEITSVFEALAFSGIALLISSYYSGKVQSRTKTFSSVMVHRNI